MQNILILSSGTNANFHITKVLHEKFRKDYYIVGADINEGYLTSSFNFLDKFYQVPRFTDKNYYHTIIHICEIENINYILASFDKEQFLFPPENIDLQRLAIKSLSCSSSVLKIYQNKKIMNKWLQENHLPVPKFYDKETIVKDSEYFIKPINGVGSIGTKKILGHEVLLLKDFKDYIIQEVCLDPEITVECFYYNGNLYSICRERIDTKSGVCIKARIFHNDFFEKVCLNFARKIHAPMIFNLQFMKNTEQQYVITDVNLRTAGGMSMSAIAGWDYISALALILQDKNGYEKYLPEISETYVMRAYSDIITKRD